MHSEITHDLKWWNLQVTIYKRIKIKIKKILENKSTGMQEESIGTYFIPI